MTRYSKKLIRLKQTYGNLCVYCKVNDSNTVDHIIPATRSGSNNLENLLPACKKCNVKKGIISIYDYCTKSTLAEIDNNRNRKGYCQILDFLCEGMLPIKRKLNNPVKKTRAKVRLNTLVKLDRLQYNENTSKLLASYMESEIYLEHNSKRIISLIYYGNYQCALDRIAKHKKFNCELTIMKYCYSESNFKIIIEFLKLFFKNKSMILNNVSLIPSLFNCDV
ncbi:MAG: HNH endonuclease [Neisseriaceae bacterium]|nr:MAG: HNH endonuclease [Neisseriaceae bacterium]